MLPGRGPKGRDITPAKTAYLYREVKNMLFVAKRCKPPYLLLGISVLLALVITLCNFTTFAIASDADLKVKGEHRL